MLNAYEKLGRDILEVIEPDEGVKTGLPLIISDPENDGLQSNSPRALQPELEDAVLRLLGSERRPA